VEIEVHINEAVCKTTETRKSYPSLVVKYVLLLMGMGSVSILQRIQNRDEFLHKLMNQLVEYMNCDRACIYKDASDTKRGQRKVKECNR
jgi:hypothetical protein